MNETELIRLKPVAKLAYLGMVENKSDTHLAQLIFEEEEIELAGICEADRESIESIKQTKGIFYL